MSELLQTELSTVRGASLGRGLAGLAVFFAAKAEALGEKSGEAVALSCLRRASTERRGLRSDVELFGGAAGIVWAYECLGGASASHETRMRWGAAIDESMAKAVGADEPWQGSFDLVSGLAGVGVYWLARPIPLRRDALREVVSRLAAMAIPDGEGKLFYRSSRYYLDAASSEDPFQGNPSLGFVDMGVAHGVAGVVGLLTRCLRIESDVGEARALLGDLVSWVVSSGERHGWGGPERHAPFMGCGPQRVFHISLPSWCFGGPGTALALADTYPFLDEPLRSKTERLVRWLAHTGVDRRKAETLADLSVCHGVAGTAHVLRRLANRLDDAAIEAAARHAFDLLLGHLGSPSRLEQHLKTEGVGVVTGLAGIGLVLASALRPGGVRWDDFMLCSEPYADPGGGHA